MTSAASFSKEALSASAIVRPPLRYDPEGCGVASCLTCGPFGPAGSEEFGPLSDSGLP
jgi:hypothetical protein